MIVMCAYCGGLPLEDLEQWGERAWAKHVYEEHPEWPPEVAEHEWPPTEPCPIRGPHNCDRSAHYDGQEAT